MKHNLLSITTALLALSFTACSANHVLSPNANSPENAQDLGLELDHKEVKRYDCKGALTSDQIEVVSPPTLTVTIAPSTVNFGTITSETFKDVQTGSSPGYIWGEGSFKIDHGDGYFSMKVVDGINEIRYQFNFSNAPSETGSRFINVKYSEVLKPGFIEIRPTPQDCAAPTPTPTPTPTP